MFQRILIREMFKCIACLAQTVHCRVRSSPSAVDSSSGSGHDGWECERCGSVETDLAREMRRAPEIKIRR